MTENELKEMIVGKPITIGLLGVIGAGKSTFAEAFTKKSGIKSVEEKFGENPFLKNFYDNPEDFSFKSQLWFLTKKIDQLKKLTNEDSHLIDPALEMDRLYAKTLAQMGFMSKPEFGMYTEIFDTLVEKNKIKSPDIYLWIEARADVVVKRIKKRERPFEMKMLAEYPYYLSQLGDSIKGFVNGNKNAKVIYINTTGDDFISEIQMQGNWEKIKRNLK